MTRYVEVKLTEREAVALLVAAELYAQEVFEGAGIKDVALTRAVRKVEASRVAARA